MSKTDVLKQIADEHYKLAELYLELAGESVASVNDSAAPVSPPRPAAADSLPAAPARPPVEDDFAEGADAMCPKHHDLYTEGQYGPYCRHQTDDPAWAKLKPDGKMFCKITPKNAAQYLRVRAAAA